MKMTPCGGPRTLVFLAIFALLCDVAVGGSCREAKLCCTGRDSSCVVQKAPINAIIEDLSDKPCYCDHACLKLGDCCPDFKEACGGSRSRQQGGKHHIHPGDRLPDISPRIIGGEEAPPHAYPFQVAIASLRDGSSSVCGGTLISSNMVLTAAHCLDHDPVSVRVYLGTHRFAVREAEKSVVLSSSDYVIHWLWDMSLLQNDIALIRLPRNVTFNEYIQPVELASGSKTYAGEQATIIGWGNTEKGNMDKGSVLKIVNTTIMSTIDCKSAEGFAYNWLILPSHICASGAGIVGGCSGDSGGPLIVDGVQVGIASFVGESCTRGDPTVFTRVSEFRDWITLARANISRGQFAAVTLLAFCSSYFIN